MVSILGVQHNGIDIRRSSLPGVERTPDQPDRKGTLALGEYYESIDGDPRPATAVVEMEKAILGRSGVGCTHG